MSERAVRAREAGDWEDVPFQLPPLPFRGRVRKALTNGVCFVGMAIAKATSVLRGKRTPIAPRKILTVRRGGLGDLLMATPLLRGLREQFPAAKIYVLTSRQAVAGLEGNPCVDRIWEVPKSIKGWLQLLRELRKEQIDTAFVLHRFFAASLVAVGARIPQRLGFNWKNHGFALTGSIPFSPGRSQTAQIGQLLTLLGKPAAEPTMEFTVNEYAIRSARELLEGWAFDPTRPLVGIHPGGGETVGSSEPAKRWLPERFGRLAELLVQRKGVQVVMLQGPGDEPFVHEALRNMTARVLGVAAGLPLAVSAAVIRQCDLVVANDSGPMHLVAALRVPFVAIVGPTHPAYTPPWRGMHKVIWAGVHCSPCYHPEEYVFGARANGKKLFQCWRGTHECMAAITAEDVYDAVVREIRADDRARRRPVALNSYPTFGAANEKSSHY